MVTMSDVWDRAMDVLRGRTGQLAGVAALTLFVPGLIRNAVPLFAAPGSIGFALVGGVVAIVVLLIAVWGQLALLAIATDPRTSRTDATRQATARFPAVLAVTIVAVLIAVALMIPFVIAIVLSHADVSAMSSTGSMPDIGGGTATFLLLYLLALAAAGLAIVARLLLTNAVVLNERRALGAFRRSWQITRGLTWRIIGVLVLYLIVLGIAMSAAQFITGAVFGLLLGRTALVAFLAAAAGGAVTTIFSVMGTAFIAQLYAAVTDRGVATVFE
jgi:hypothetical protein